MRVSPIIALVLLAGCATVAKAPRVAFLPVETVGVPAEQGEALQGELLKEIERTGAAVAAPSAKVLEALRLADPTAPPCRESDACLARAGRDAQCDSVLALTLAGIGNTWLVKGRLLRSQDGLALQEVQETAEGGVEAVGRYGPQLANRLFPDPGRRPVYKQWWFWTSVAAAAVAAGSVATWAALQGGGPASSAVIIGSL